MIRRLVLLSVLFAGFALPATPAMADVMSSVNLHWDSLKVTLVDLPGGAPLSFSWTGSELGEVHSFAVTADPLDDKSDDPPSANDFTTLLSSDLTTAKAQASATRGSATLSASAASQLGTSPSGFDTNYADGTAVNSGDFELTGNGIALITMDWDAILEGTLGDSSDDASVNASVYATYDDGAFDQGYAFGGVSMNTHDSGSGTWSGTLSMTIPNLGVTTTGTLFAYANADASSPNIVPEPASCVLMGLGLGLVGWISCRRRK